MSGRHRTRRTNTARAAAVGALTAAIMAAGASPANAFSFDVPLPNTGLAPPSLSISLLGQFEVVIEGATLHAEGGFP